MGITDAIKKLNDEIKSLKDKLAKAQKQNDQKQIETYKSKLDKAQTKLTELQKAQIPKPSTSNVTPTPTPTPLPPVVAEKPSDVFDLTNWYLTTPVGTPGSPLCVYSPDLKTYVNDKYFHLSDTKDAIVFIANCGGVTTKGTKYPRSELREMINNGKDRASWSTSSGKHTMTVVESIHHVPKVKSEVVCAQYHDSSDDCIEIGLRGNRLIAFHDSTIYGILDNDYKLGTKFTLKIVVENDTTTVYYNDMTKPKITAPTKYNGCYWKAGCYTQSNTTKGDSADDYAEVHIYSLKVEHTS